MSHGARVVKEYGSHTSLRPVEDIFNVLVPGTREHRQFVRKKAAELVYEIRAMWPELHGRWTRHQWNAQARNAGRQYVKNTIRFATINR